MAVTVASTSLNPDHLLGGKPIRSADVISVAQMLNYAARFTQVVHICGAAHGTGIFAINARHFLSITFSPIADGEVRRGLFQFRESPEAVQLLLISQIVMPAGHAGSLYWDIDTVREATHVAPAGVTTRNATLISAINPGKRLVELILEKTSESSAISAGSLISFSLQELKV